MFALTMKLALNINTVEINVSVHPREAEKVSATGVAAFTGMCIKIQSLYELEFKRGFVKGGRK